MAPLTGRDWVQRVAALVLVVLVVPAVMSVSAFLQDTPIREGEPSPRTVIAPDLIRISDPEATEREQRAAAEAVEPVLVDDEEARREVVQEVRDVFARVRAAREPGDDERPPSRAEQIEALSESVAYLEEEGIRRLVNLSDDDLVEVREDTVEIAQQLARQQIEDGEADAAAEQQLRNELAVRAFPDGVAEGVVDPLIRQAAQPTVRIDEEATAAQREEAAAEVGEVVRTFVGGTAIVSAGEVVDEIQMQALQARGLEGAEPWQWLARAIALAVAATAAVGFYIRAYRARVWASARKLLLLAVLYTAFAAAVQAVALLAPEPTSGWLFLVPAGAVAMLATILFDPPVGVLSALPMAAVVAFTAPSEPGVIVFTVLSAIASVPLVSRLSARGDLRRAALWSTLGYVALATVLAAVFEGPVPVAAAAGLVNGVASAVIVNGSLPFLESVFGVLTATSLLDLQDRNHPLLRELEQKALGSYNHSIQVSTMVDRACRAIGADALLGSVAALYHDIGKVRRPYFFVENQFGIGNPHDDLPPEVSAEIIQRHVSDGIEMARSSRLPAEVVEGIATHHGTTLVSYFYRQAVNAAAADTKVDEAVYRYPGRKPSSKEMAVLMLADCCEGASRAAAQHDRNLTKADLERIVEGLVTDRIDDGQLDEASLTFRELKIVQDAFIEALVGFYHPRITYPALATERAEQDPQPAPSSSAYDGASGGTHTRQPNGGSPGQHQAPSAERSGPADPA